MSAAGPVSLACRVEGDGPPLVILHGLFGSGSNWRTIARRLAARRTIYLADARNHGASPHAEGMDYDTLAEDVRALLDVNELDAADVVGHSMGGKTAMVLALRAPERVRRLTVIDIAPGASPGDHAPLIAAMRALPLERMTRRAEADAALADSIPDAGVRAFLGQNLESRDGGLAWRIGLDAIERAMPDLLGFPEFAPGVRYEGPALFLRGAESPYVRDAHLPAIRERFPKATLETVDGAGHWVHAERPDAVADAIETLLDE